MVAKVNAASVPRSERILGRANCLATDEVEDCVRIRAPKSGGRFEVEKVDISVSGSLPMVAIVIKKYAATDCIIQFHGPMRGIYTGLAPNEVYLVGTDARLAKEGDANYPAIGSDFFQTVGVATSDDEFLIRPSLDVSFGRSIASSRVYQQVLVPTVDPKVFTTSIKFIRNGVDDEVVSYNGQRLVEGVGEHYVASESGGIGTGYDTITLSFTPRALSKWYIDFTPDV